MIQTKYNKGVLALILLSFGFGAIPIAARHLSVYLTVLQQLYISLGIGFILSLFIFRTNFTVLKIKKIPTKDWLILLARIFVGYLVAGTLYRESLNLTKISNVTFIQALPFSAILGWIIFKEKFTFTKFLLTFVAYAGVLLIAIKDYSSILTFGRGEVFSFVSAALFSLSYLSSKWMTDYLNNKEVTQILLFIGTIVLFIVSLLSGEALPVLTWQWGLFWAIFFSGFFNATNIFLINYGFRNVKAVLASNIITLEAVFAVILAYIFFKELPNLKELIGGGLIIGSVIQMNRLEAK